MLFFRFVLILSLSASTFAGLCAKVDTLDVPSAGMTRILRTAVVLPEGYVKAKKRNKHPFPVLYLLHGEGGSFRDWLTKTPDKQLLHRLADQYSLIIVTPDAQPLPDAIRLDFLLGLIRKPQ